MKMYADYLKERLGDGLVETPHGFATYRFTDEKSCYIVDIYVDPAHRKKGIAGDLADHITEIAKARGCTRLLGSVVPSSHGSTDSVRVLLAYGMRLDSSANDFILFRKDI